MQKIFFCAFFALFFLCSVAIKGQTVILYRSFNPATDSCSDASNILLEQINSSFTRGLHQCVSGSYVPVNLGNATGATFPVTFPVGYDMTEYITNFYEVAFLRQPTALELSNNTTTLTNACLGSDGTIVFRNTAATYGQSFFTSVEYTSRSRTDTEFINDLYLAYLGRPGETAGVTFWVSQIATLTRAGVSAAFAFSMEYINNRLTPICYAALYVADSIAFAGATLDLADSLTRSNGQGWFYNSTTGKYELKSITGTSPIVATVSATAIDLSCPSCSPLTINPTDTFLPSRSNSTTFIDSPFARVDADTIDMYDISNVTENSTRFNLYGLKNGTNHERASLFYDIGNDWFMLDVNIAGTGVQRALNLGINNTAYWQLTTAGAWKAFNASARFISGGGSVSSPAIQVNDGGAWGIYQPSVGRIGFSTSSTYRADVSDIGFLTGSGDGYYVASTSLGRGTTVDSGIERDAANRVRVVSTTTGTLADLKVRQHYVDQTITAGGTTGNQTINKAHGTVNFAAAASTLTVTNNLVTTSSSIYWTVRTNDSTCTVKNIVPSAGSFVITMSAACNAETSVGFHVINQ